MKVQKAMTNKVTEQWNEFIRDTVLPHVRTTLMEPRPNAFADGDYDELNEWPISVFYSGDGLEELEVMEALKGDSMLSGLSFTFVLLYLFIHTKSFLLSALGLFNIAISVPL